MGPLQDLLDGMDNAQHMQAQAQAGVLQLSGAGAGASAELPGAGGGDMAMEDMQVRPVTMNDFMAALQKVRPPSVEQNEAGQ